MNSTGRYYTWHGELYPAVTSILQAFPKPALPRWAARVVAEAVVQQAERWLQLARQDPAKAVQELAAIPWSERNSAANLGSTLHRAAEAIAQGKSFEAGRDALPYVRQFMRFLEDHQPAFRYNESTVYSRRYRYAGTFDAIVTMDGQLVLMDFKTSKQVYPEYALQLAAYRNADFIGAPDGQEIAMPEVDATAVLHITPDTYRLVPMDTSHEVFEVFLAVLRLANWINNHASP